MMKRKFGTILAALVLTGIIAVKVQATIGDIWAVTQGSADVWRITSAGNMLPGTTDAYEIGSSTKKVKKVWATDLNFTSLTVGAYACDSVTATNVVGTAVNGTTGTFPTLNTTGTATIGVVTLAKEIRTPLAFTVNATMASANAQVNIGAIAGNVTLTLPTPALGQIISIQDCAGNVSVQGNVTIAAAGGQTINGAASIPLSTAWGGYTLVGVSGTAWAAR